MRKRGGQRQGIQEIQKLEWFYSFTHTCKMHEHIHVYCPEHDVILRITTGCM